MKKIVVYIDMDGVVADFKTGIGRSSPEWNPPEMYVKGFFRSLPVMPGAKEAIAELLDNPKLDIFIASKPDSKNLDSATEKFEWIQEHFPPLLKKIFLTCDKGHLNGDFLIDDFEDWRNKFPGTFIKFDEENPTKCWKEILAFFRVLTS